MGHKVNPTGIRIGITTGWQSRWFGVKKDYREQLRKDVEIRSFVTKSWKQAAIASVQIERSRNVIRLIIETSRPVCSSAEAAPGLKT
ncbi:MAG: hypothetical protein WDN67_00035 [Candidatus Moraniibacteriota bacterium]